MLLVTVIGVGGTYMSKSFYSDAQLLLRKVLSQV